MTFTSVAVVGAGLIGGSAARRLHDRGVDVVVVDPDPVTREHAAAAGIAVAEAVPPDRDLVVVATPLDVLPRVLAEVAAAAPDAVVVDVGSVKAPAVAAASAAGLVERYVGCHPMAGTERSGFDHSGAALLVAATWAVVRGPAVDLVARVVAFLVEEFDATVLVLDADEHDRAVALASHAPHALANALLELVERAPDGAATVHLAAGSFRDGTRVAGRNAARTANMLVENAEALGPVLDELVAVLQSYRVALDDPDALRGRLERLVDAEPAIRRPAVTWSPSADLRAVVGGSGRVLVRGAATGFEHAEV